MIAPPVSRPARAIHLLGAALFVCLISLPLFDAVFHVAPEVNVMEGGPGPSPFAEPGPAGEGLVGEAQRCLGCGTCIACGLCHLFCPDLAVEFIGGQYYFNLDYCKGCGVCVRECPAQALSMRGEDDAG